MHRAEIPYRRASAGDRVVLTGDGFPEGRRADRDLPGRSPPARDQPPRPTRLESWFLRVSRRLRDAVVADRSISALERRFVGSGDGALHTTFHGDVRVTFEPGATGVTSVSGTAHDVRFDVLPSRAEASSDAEPGRTARGRGPSRFSASTREAPIRAAARDSSCSRPVEPDGRAARSGRRLGRPARRNGRRLGALPSRRSSRAAGQHVA